MLYPGVGNGVSAEYACATVAFVAAEYDGTDGVVTMAGGDEYAAVTGAGVLLEYD
jgi:hypothetical protein